MGASVNEGCVEVKGQVKSKKHICILMGLMIVGWPVFWTVLLNIQFERRLDVFRQEFIMRRSFVDLGEQSGIKSNEMIEIGHESVDNDSSISYLITRPVIDEVDETISLLKDPQGIEVNKYIDKRSVEITEELKEKTTKRRLVRSVTPRHRSVTSRTSRSAEVVNVDSNNDKKSNKKKTASIETGKQRLAPKMIAAHYIAPADMARQYESGPVVSFNSSADKDIVYRFWRQAPWVDRKAEQLFHLDTTTGIVTVEETGLYLVYAQVVYHDISGRWSFGIYIADTERVKCLATEQLGDLAQYDQHSHGVYQQCYTSQVMHIKKNQSVTIRCLYGSRRILTKPEFTFWGIVRL